MTEDEPDVLQVVQHAPGKADQSDQTSQALTHRFKFHRVFGMESTQETIFDTVALPICQRFLAGFNCTIFAYGQTGMLHACVSE